MNGIKTTIRNRLQNLPAKACISDSSTAVAFVTTEKANTSHNNGNKKYPPQTKPLVWKSLRLRRVLRIAANVGRNAFLLLSRSIKSTTAFNGINPNNGIQQYWAGKTELRRWLPFMGNNKGIKLKKLHLLY